MTSRSKVGAAERLGSAVARSLRRVSLVGWCPVRGSTALTTSLFDDRDIESVVVILREITGWIEST